MALTNESFRDPRKQYTLRAISGFYLADRAVKPGETVNVPRSIAAELLHGNKAEMITDRPAPMAAAATPPPEAPQKPKIQPKEQST